jgi:hypothetical protein
MKNITRLLIYISLDSKRRIEDALVGLPKYCTETFEEHNPGMWNGEFIISCPIAPHVADGDFEEDFAPYFPQLLNLKTFYDGIFRLEIAVGSPDPEVFFLPPHMIALIAILGAEVWISTKKAAEQDAAANP